MSRCPSAYPVVLEIRPADRPVSGTIAPPGSKSITNRALVLAALSSVRHPVTLVGALRSEDTEVMVAALQTLGYSVEPNWGVAPALGGQPGREGEAPAEPGVSFDPGSGHASPTCLPARQEPRPPVPGRPLIRVRRGDRPAVPAGRGDLFVANSGTTMRFLTAMVALGHGTYRLDGIPRMRERPIRDLLEALDHLGVSATSEAGDGCPPVSIRGGTWRGGRVRIRGDVSSQFLSGLLLAAPFAPSTTTFEVEGGLVSRPYIEMTTRMMHVFHLRVSSPTPDSYLVPGDQDADGLPHGEYIVEPDASAASYFFAAAAITGGTVTVPGLTMHGLQGDVCFVDVLERMGCTVERGERAITVTGGKLHGIEVGMSDISDTVMTLAVVALFAEGPTTIRNVAHIRHKETDRICALAAELRRLGAGVDEFDDGLTIHPRPLAGALVHTYNDHRMAMSLALAGLRVPGVVIADPGCVAKTYPGYFYDLDSIR